MKIYKKGLLLSISFIFIFTMLLINNVSADNLDQGVHSYKWKDDSLLNSDDDVIKTFYVPENMDYDNFVINLKVKSSPTLIKDLSSISVLVNNTTIHSVVIEKIDTDGLIDIKVPKELIHTGENSIVVRGFFKSTREKCEINDDINWTIIEKDSSFSFNYDMKDSESISNIFNNTYFSDGTSSEFNLTTPDNLVKDNYSQVSSISSLLGFNHKNKSIPVTPRIYKYSELYDLDKETIMIGTVDQIKDFDENLLTDEEWEVAKENGYVTIKKIGIKNHFIIITSNESQIETFCKIFQNKTSLSQIKVSNYILNKSKIVNQKEFNSNPSLSDLEYGNSLQSGNGVKTFNYYFKIPAKKTLTENNKLTFFYNYSSLVDYDEAYLTVKINGENLMSQGLLKDKNKDKLEFTIPEKYFDYNGFDISLEFNLKPSIENCTSQSHDDIWIEMDSINSNLDLDIENREKYSLLNAQGLLQDSRGYIDGNMVVDSYKNLSLYSISKLSSYLGSVCEGVNKLFINESTNSQSSNNFILSLNKSPIIKTLNNDLRIPISKNGNFVNKDLFVQNTPSLGSIQLTSDNEKLVISANNVMELNKTIQSYSEVINSKDSVIVKEGKVIDSFDQEKLSEDKSLDMIKTSSPIILSLLVLLGASVLK